MKKLAISAAVLLAAAGGYMGYTSAQTPDTNRLMIENIEALTDGTENPTVTDRVDCWSQIKYSPNKACIVCSSCALTINSEGDCWPDKCTIIRH